MVCLGNICRSPLAEGIMQQKIAEKGLSWSVDSAGTGSWHIRSAPDRRSILIARQNDIDISKQRGRQFESLDFELFDHIFVMDTQNMADVLRLASSEADRAKVALIMDQIYPGEQHSVPDPYYDDNGFEAVFDMLDQACEAFVRSHS